MNVIKYDGRIEKFQRKKIIRTCLRVGVQKDVANSIADKIEKILYDGITTKEIYRNILKELNKYEKKTASIYGLRESIALMNPVVFEIFVKKLLESYGYSCRHDKIVQGLCIDHQIDIIAERNETYLVECKRHQNAHRFCGLNVCLQVEARFEDVSDGFNHNKNKYNFDRAWIITNTKFSEHAKKYSRKKNIKLTGWKYPDNESLEKLIEEKKMFPVTILRTRKNIIQKISDAGIITIHDMTKERLKKAGIEENHIIGLLKQKTSLLNS